MKKTIISVFLLAYVISSPYTGYAAESEVGFLVEILVENGTMTRVQAQELAQKARMLEAEAARAKKRERDEIIRKCIEQLEKNMRTLKDTADISWEPIREREQDIPMEVSWKDGIRFESPGGDFETKIGGRVFTDILNTYGHGDLPNTLRPGEDFNNRNDMAYIRSARLSIEGTMYDDYFYSFEYEFDGETNDKLEVEGLRDMYLGMKNVPFLGRVSAGHMKEPFSLEETTSSSNITFLERSLANVFAPGFSWGVASQNAILDDRVTYGAGVFLHSDRSSQTTFGDAWNFTTRVTGLPWYGGEDKLWHIGTSYSLRNPKEGGYDDHEVRFRQRPDMYTRDRIVDTGTLYVEGENRLGFETAFMYGPFSLQGEVIQTWIDPYDSSLDTGHLYGGYGAISYILTGEHRIYDKNDGRFQGVIPNNNFSFKDFSLSDHTWGAWEITARWSYLSLDDGDMDIDGGETHATTVGLNWYLNPNMRIMLNWVRSKLRGTEGSIDGIQVRAQVTF